MGMIVWVLLNKGWHKKINLALQTLLSIKKYLEEWG